MTERVRIRGGARRIVPARRCFCCGAELVLWCQARKVYRWGIGPFGVEVEFIQLVCKRADCQRQAAGQGWL